MGIAVVLIISLIVIPLFTSVGAIVQGVWLQSLLSGLRQWEFSVLGQVTLAPYLTWIIAIGLLLFAVRLFSHTK